jgi:phosphoribosylformylglycinamidine synthase
MGQLVGAVRGIAEACRALDFPIVSGNVSLYNETNGRGILPTPTIGGVGLIPDWSRMARAGFAAPGELILLFGAPPEWGTHLGQSIWLREIRGREEGPPPPVDLEHEKKAGDLVRALIAEGMVTAVHDLSDGGLAVGLAEMAMAAGIGATIDQPEGGDPTAVFFGEDQGRYVVTLPETAVEALRARAGAAGVAAVLIGRTGGAQLKLGRADGISVARLREAHEGWFPAYMAGA